MPEFYKYAERQAGSQVNWAGLGVDMADTLNAEEKIREQKRADIDNATNKAIQDAQNLPIGEEANGNRLVANYTSNVKNLLLIQNKLLKSGKLNPKDYLLVVNNIKSGTDQMFNLQTEYQKQYSETMKRMKTGESQDAESDLRAYYESFADLSKTNPVIDPMTGQVNLGVMEYDKNHVLQPTGKTTSVQSAYKGLSQKFDRFKVADATKSIADSLGNVVLTNLQEGSLTKKGQLITLDYALQDPNTAKALDGYVDSYLENPYNVSSILTNDIHGYSNTFSHDPKQKSNGNTIVWNMDSFGAWKPNMSEEQKKAAKDYLLQQTKAQISQKKEIKEFTSAALEAYNSNTSRINANKVSGGIGTTLPDGQEWINYVSENVPKLGIGKAADDLFIKELKENLTGMKLDFESDGKEGIKITDTADNNSVSITIPLRNNPNARQQIIDYIMTNKADVGKDLIATGVINKNVKNTGGLSNTGSKYKGR